MNNKFIMFVSVAALAVSLQAQTLTPLHDFVQLPTGDGLGPQAGLVMDTSGNLYGTTLGGGAHGVNLDGLYLYGPGTVFEITPSGTEILVYSFGAAENDSSIGGYSDGSFPSSDLVIDQNGNLYGTTTLGGSANLGTIFEITKGVETVLHNFTCADGAFPFGGLVMDTGGNFYGTASQGGDGFCTPAAPTGNGVIFELSSTGQFSLLHNFAGSPSDASDPTGTLVLDQTGNLYGIAGGGIYGSGSIFKLATQAVTPPAPPVSELGMAGISGTTAPRRPILRSFKLKRQAITSNQLTLLYSFNVGVSIASGRLLLDAQGNLYGVTAGDTGLNDGTVFKLDSTGQLTTLHTFLSTNYDGYLPNGGLVMDKAGNIYGTTSEGGTFQGESGFGTLFKIDTNGNETILYNFGDDSNASLWAGEYPNGDIMMDGSGNIYGTSHGFYGMDSALDWGTAFKFGPVQ